MKCNVYFGIENEFHIQYFNSIGNHPIFTAHVLSTVRISMTNSHVNSKKLKCE